MKTLTLNTDDHANIVMSLAIVLTSVTDPDRANEIQVTYDKYRAFIKENGIHPELAINTLPAKWLFRYYKTHTSEISPCALDCIPPLTSMVIINDKFYEVEQVYIEEAEKTVSIHIKPVAD